MLKAGLAALILLAGAAVPIAAQQTSSTIKAQLIARLQMQYTTTSVDEAELIAAGRNPAALPSSMFEARRIRFGSSVEFSDFLSGELELEFAMARLQMRNVFMELALSPGVELRMGQFKKPFSMLELNSETVWPIIERGVRIRGLTDGLQLADSLAGGTRVLTSFRGNIVPGEHYEILNTLGYVGYDLGVLAHGRLGAFGYAAGVFNGEGSDRADSNDGKSYAARVTYRLGSSRPIALGAAVSHRETRVTTRPTITSLSGTAFEADIEIGGFRKSGLHFMGEVTTGDNLAFDNEKFLAAQGVLAYFVPVARQRIEGVEFAGRASYGDPRTDVDADEGLLLTPGFNVYFNGRNRLMINWDLYRALGDRLTSENALRFQAQLYH